MTTGGDALLEWRNTAACSRRRVRPDGYGMIRRRGELYGFFLEYDRGTHERPRLRREVGRLLRLPRQSRLRARLRWLPDDPRRHDRQDGRGADRPISPRRAVGRWPPLPILLTCEWRIARDPTNPDGLLGPIWREPTAAFHERRPWPALAQGTKVLLR